MQTFVPFGADFAANARVLDRRRLGKQRVEGLQILNALLGRSRGWRSHPAVRMWEGYENALIEYVVAICDEWTSRGYRDSCKQKVLAMKQPGDSAIPKWLNDYEVMLSHRSNLVRKMPEHYRQFWPDVDASLEYKWVASDRSSNIELWAAFAID